MGREPRQDERGALSGLDGELRHGAQVLAAYGRRRPQRQRIRPRDGDAHIVVDAAHPRNDRAVAEPDHELHPDRHRSLDALDDPHDVRILAAGRHEVDHADDARLAMEVELVHQRAFAIAPLDVGHLAVRRQQPAAVPLIAEQRREARIGVEAGQAEPVDRAVPAHERGGLQVADQAVILELHPAEFGSCGGR